MALLQRAQRLKKELGVVGAYAIATGATFSSGFFLLPGLAAAEVGPALVLSYLLAAIPILPAALCMVELATAMPRAGGAYFFFDRSMGPLLGTIGGAGTWMVLVLKTCFALVGMGAYLHLLEPRLPITWLAAALALFFGALNLLGARGTASTQIALVGGLLSIVGWFLFSGMRSLEPRHFDGVFQAPFDSLVATGGMVFISYVGVTKVASMAEEIRNPERNLPIAVFASLGTAIVVYALGTIVMVGVVPPRDLAGDLTPVATAANVLAGPWGRNLLAFAALLAFASVANAGILSASRYPLAMSRDHLLPGVVRKLSGRRIPYVSVCGTVAAVLVALALLDPAKIAKLGSAFQLVVFALICLAVIIMRESRIESYDPAFRSPFYPYLQIAGIATPLLFIADMGWLPIGFCVALPLVCGIWYYHFARTRVARSGAIRHVFHRLGERRFGGLDTELRVILKEKGLRSGDPFEQVVAHAMFVEAPAGTTFREATRQAAERLAPSLAESVESTIKNFLDGTAVGATPTA
jgi:amino acid transporter